MVLGRRMHGIRALCYLIHVHLEDFRNSIKLDSLLCSEIQGLQPINSWRLNTKFSQRRSRRQFSSLETFCQNRQKERRRKVSGTKSATMRWTKALRMPILNAKQMELAIPDNFTEIVPPPLPFNFFQLTCSVQRFRRYHTSRASLFQTNCSTNRSPRPRPRLP
jgi:hypothetical protein